MEQSKQVQLMQNKLPPSLLHSWIRRFTMIISAWWLRTSSKLC